MLADTGLFKVSEKDYPKPSGIRLNYWSQFQIDNCRIGLDTWDTQEPLNSFLKEGHFTKGCLKDLDVVIKLQAGPSRFYNRFESNTGIQLRTWTIMVSDFFKPEFFQWKPSGHTHTASMTGNLSRGSRRFWTRWAKSQPDFIVSDFKFRSIPPSLRSDYATKLANAKPYTDAIQACKWGLILKGFHWHDGKNRREAEYSSCGIPLALNYKPTYPFRMEPNVDYLYLEKPEDLAKLRTVDPAPFAIASQRLWKEHFSPLGAAKTLLRILNDLPKGKHA